MMNSSGIEESRDRGDVLDQSEIVDTEPEKTSLVEGNQVGEVPECKKAAIQVENPVLLAQQRWRWQSGLLCFLVLCFLGGITINEQIQAYFLLNSEKMRGAAFQSEDPMRLFDRLRDRAIELQEAKRYRAALLLLDEAQKLTKPYGRNNVYTARLLGIESWCYFGLGEHDKARTLMKSSIDMWYATRGKRTSWAARSWHDLSKMCSDDEGKRRCLDQALWCATHSQGPLAMFTVQIWIDAHRNEAASAPFGSGRAADLKGSQLEGLNMITEEGQELPERKFQYQNLRRIDEALIRIIDQQAGDSDEFEKRMLALLKERLLSNKGILRGTALVELDHELFFQSIHNKGDALHLKATALNRLASLLHLIGKHEQASALDTQSDLLFEAEWSNHRNNRN